MSQSPACERLLLEALAAALGALLLGGVALAADPLYQQEPFDRITLDAANKNMVLKVEPLDFPDRRVPQKPPKKLTVRLVDQPDEPYEVQWSAIAKLELFEDLVLAEGKRLVQAGQMDDAYDYFQDLEKKDPKYPGLQEAVEEYLYEEAKARHLGQQYDGALAMLHELYRRNPQRAGLDRAMGLATEKLVEKHVAAARYAAARALLRSLAEAFAQHPTTVQWEGRFKTEAGQLFAEAKRAQAEGRLRQAQQAALRVANLWPALPGAKELVEAIHGQYPRVVVGVMRPAVSLEPCRLDDWAARRRSRLVYRTLMEFVGPGPEGGEYRSPLGQLAVQELGLRLVVDLKPGLRWSTGQATLTGYDLSRRLLALADPADPAYRPDWGELLGSVSVPRVYTLEVDLRRPHVRPQALLQTTVVPYSDPSIVDPEHLSNGPYSVDAKTGQETIYVANGPYFAAAPGQPKEVVERHFRLGGDAITALKRRQIDVLDRVNPWDLDKLLADPEIVVERYAMPLVHCLVPNTSRPLLANSNFRRALAYGINRPMILGRLLNGKDRDGCRVISGPFSPGIAGSDPLDYAYDKSIEPRDYDPRLTIALAQVGFRQAAEAVKKQGGKPLAEMPRLVLAHAPEEVARLASASIQKQLGVLGIPVTLQELPPGAPARIPDDVDLLYAELAMWEPVVDARRLLDHDGLAGGSSPYMSLALRQLEEAATWPEVGSRLRRIHAIAQQSVWEFTPYQVDVVLALGDAPELTPRLHDDLASALAHRTSTVIGAAWNLTVTAAPPKLSRAMIADVEAFAPLAQVAAADKKEATLRLRAAALPVRDPSLAVVKPGDLFQPLFRYNDREGNPRRILLVRSGGEFLARLPIVPGMQPETAVPVPDKLLQRLRALPTREELVRRLDQEAKKLVSPDPAMQRKIDALFEETRKLLSEHLNPADVEKLTAQIVHGRVEKDR